MIIITIHKDTICGYTKDDREQPVVDLINTMDFSHYSEGPNFIILSTDDNRSLTISLYNACILRT